MSSISAYVTIMEDYCFNFSCPELRLTIVAPSADTMQRLAKDTHRPDITALNLRDRSRYAIEVVREAHGRREREGRARVKGKCQVSQHVDFWPALCTRKLNWNAQAQTLYGVRHSPYLHFRHCSVSVCTVGCSAFVLDPGFECITRIPCRSRSCDCCRCLPLDLLKLLHCS